MNMQITQPSHRWQLTFEGHWPTSVVFLGHQNRIAAANRGGQILIWDLPESPPEEAAEGDPKAKEPPPPNFAPSRQLIGHENAVSHLLATADGNTLISSSLDRTIRLWDVNAATTGSADVVLDSQQRNQQARRKPEDQKAAILEAPGIQVATVEARTILTGHEDWVTALAVSGDGRRLISGDNSSHVFVWDLESHARVATWNGYPWNGIFSTALSADGQTALVSESRFKRDDFDIPAPGLKVWHVMDGSERSDLLKLQFPKLDTTKSTYGAAQVWRKFVAGGLIGAVFSADEKWIAVGQAGETDSGKVHLFDRESGKLVRTVSGHRNGVCDVKFSADSKYVLSSGRDTMIRICQVEDGKEVAALGKERGGQFKDWLHAIAISPNQKTVAAADIAGMVHVWQL
jgi:WD40 repeat protein